MPKMHNVKYAHLLKDNIWVADLADMQLNKFNKIIQFQFLLYIIDIFSFFNCDSMQGRITVRHGVARKRSTKRLKHTENLFRKKLQLTGVC